MMDVKIRLPGILLVHDAVCLPSLRLSLMCTSRRSVYSPNPWNHKKIQDSISSSHGLNKPFAHRQGRETQKTSYIPAFSQHRRTKLCCMRKIQHSTCSSTEDRQSGMVCGNGASTRLVFAMWCMVSGIGGWGQKERKTTDGVAAGGGGGGEGGGRGGEGGGEGGGVVYKHRHCL